MQITGLFYKFFYNIGRCFWRYNALCHIVAIAVTCVLIFSGFDWFYFQSTRNSQLQLYLFPAAIIGGLLPLLVPLVMFIAGLVTKNFRTVNTAFGLGQAAILGSLISSFYKALTGRIYPPTFSASSLIDTSRMFKFGLLRAGVFWGWPSSHTTIAFAMAITLCILFPKNKSIRYASLLYALYIGIGVSTNIHWFSDFAAGTIIGTIIGVVVGKAFLARYQENVHNA